MIKFDRRTTANMNTALENACRSLPNGGGDHATRKYVAKRLIEAAGKGDTSPGALEDVARQALHDLSRGEVA